MQRRHSNISDALQLIYMNYIKRCELYKDSREQHYELGVSSRCVEWGTAVAFVGLKTFLCNEKNENWIQENRLSSCSLGKFGKAEIGGWFQIFHYIRTSVVLSTWETKFRARKVKKPEGYLV